MSLDPCVTSSHLHPVTALGTLQVHNPTWTRRSSTLSEFGSEQLEFAKLSMHSGNSTYADKAESVIRYLYEQHPDKVRAGRQTMAHRWGGRGQGTGGPRRAEWGSVGGVLLCAHLGAHGCQGENRDFHHSGLYTSAGLAQDWL